MAFTKRYVIQTEHTTQGGATVPSNFIVEVGRVSAEPLEGQDEWVERVEVRTFKDKSNADAGSGMPEADMSFLQTTFRGKSDNQDAVDLLSGSEDRLIKPQLESEFGSSNVKPPA